MTLPLSRPNPGDVDTGARPEGIPPARSPRRAKRRKVYRPWARCAAKYAEYKCALEINHGGMHWGRDLRGLAECSWYYDEGSRPWRDVR